MESLGDDGGEAEAFARFHGRATGAEADAWRAARVEVGCPNDTDGGLSLNRRQQCDARRGKKYGDDDGLNRAQKYIVMMTNAPAKGSRSDGHKRTKQSVDSRRGDASKDSHPQET